MALKNVARPRVRRADDTFEPTKAKSDFGRFLCVVARVDDLSASDLADRMGVHRTTVVRLVRERNPRLETALRAARALRVFVNVAESLVTGKYRDNLFWRRVKKMGEQADTRLGERLKAQNLSNSASRKMVDMGIPPTFGNVDLDVVRKVALCFAHKVQEEERKSSGCDVCGIPEPGVALEFFSLFALVPKIDSVWRSPGGMLALMVIAMKEYGRHNRLRALGQPIPVDVARPLARILSAMMGAAHRPDSV